MKEKIKILEINDNYEVVGGAETYYRDIISILKKNDQDVFAFSFGEKRINDNEHFIYKENRFKFLRFLYRYTFNLRVYLSIRRYIKQIKPDVIHLHKIDNKYPLSVLLACRDKNVVSTVHDCGQVCITGWCTYKDTLTVCPGKYGLKCVRRKCIPPLWLIPIYPMFKLRDYLSKKIIKKYLCPSKMLVNKMQINGFNNVIHFPYCIEPVKFNNQLHFSNKNFNTVLYAGRISKEKGLTYLVDAFRILQDKKINAKLIIIGDGDMKVDLVKKVADLRLDNVKFLAKIPHDKIKEYQNRYSIFIVPSIWQENYPLSILETLSYGNVVLGSDIGGIKDLVVDGKTGFLFQPKNPEAISKSVLKVYNNPVLIRRLGHNAKKFGDNKHDPQKHFMEIMRIFKAQRKA